MKCEWMQKHKKEITVLFLVVMVLMILQGVSQHKQNKTYVEEGGQLVAVKRESLSDNQSIPLLIEVEEQGKKKIYEISLTLKGEATEEGQTEKIPSKEMDTVKLAIDNMVAALEEQHEQLIMLPTKLEDGKRLIWKVPSSGNVLLLFLLFPLGVFYLYRSDLDKERQAQKQKLEEIRKALPAFNDQLLLMMNSGLIFHDAFCRIAENYRQREKLDCFGALILKIEQDAECSGRTIVSAMKETTKEVSMREYSRMVNIIADNQYKGVDLKEKLESESDLLWESRKSLSLQKGKELETKLSFPLALLLLVLIIITGVPAMMAM